MLVARQVGVVKGDLAASYHGDLNSLVLLQPVEQTLEGQRANVDLDLVVVGVTLGDHSDGAAHNRAELLRLVLDDFIRLREHDLGEGKVAEGILELCNVGEALGVLKDFVAHNTGNHSGCRGNSGNNLTCNHLGLVAVALCNLVIAGSQAGRSRDEVDVEVIVVILLEVGGEQRVTSDTRDTQVSEKLSNNGFVIVVSCGVLLRCGLSLSLTLFGLFGGLHSDNFLDIFLRRHSSNDVLNLSLVEGRHA